MKRMEADERTRARTRVRAVDVVSHHRRAARGGGLGAVKTSPARESDRILEREGQHEEKHSWHPYYVPLGPTGTGRALGPGSRSRAVGRKHTQHIRTPRCPNSRRERRRDGRDRSIAGGARQDGRRAAMHVPRRGSPAVHRAPTGSNPAPRTAPGEDTGPGPVWGGGKKKCARACAKGRGEICPNYDRAGGLLPDVPPTPTVGRPSARSRVAASFVCPREKAREDSLHRRRVRLSVSAKHLRLASERSDQPSHRNLAATN